MAYAVNAQLVNTHRLTILFPIALLVRICVTLAQAPQMTASAALLIITSTVPASPVLSVIINWNKIQEAHV
jgi:hypothetical protein